MLFTGVIPFLDYMVSLPSFPEKEKKYIRIFSLFQRHLSVVSKKQVKKKGKKKDGSIIHTAINIYFVRGREASIWKSLSAKEASQGGQREEEIVCMSVCGGMEGVPVVMQAQTSDQESG